MNTRTTLRGVALAAVTAAAVAVPASHAATAKTATVKTGTKSGKFAFLPSKVTVSKGGSVTFKWADGVLHNVTSTGSKKFKSIGDRSSGSRRVTFSKAGTYHYFCSIHGASMSGVVVVK